MRSLFHEHSVALVHEKGWGGLKDGPLLAAASRKFDVLVTIDRKLEFQQNIAAFGIGLVVARVPKNQLVFYNRTAHKLRKAVELAKPGTVIHVD